MEDIDRTGKVKISLQAKVCSTLFTVGNAKKRFERTSLNPHRRGKGFVPKGISRSLSVHTQKIDRHPIATLESKTKVSGTHIILFHGGGYIFEILAFHWALARKLINRTSCRLTVVDYPLSPEHTYKETYRMIQNAYDYLANRYPDDLLILMGDSAGGGLVLGLTHKLIEENHPKPPTGNILISPALDLTLSNPGYKDLEELDLLLSLKFLNNCASVFSGGDDLSHYLLSPIKGNFENHPETLVIFGTHELFRADCLELESITGKINAPFTYIPFEGMPHDFVIMPLPESDRAISRISDFIDSIGSNSG